MELGRAGCISQIDLYLKNKEYLKAYELAKDFTARFPDEMVSHFLLARSAFELGRYDEAVAEGSRAFNKAGSDNDMLSCAILTGSAYYMCGRFEEGIRLLRFMEKKKTNAGLESLLVILSLAARNGKEAADHLNDLYRINKGAADALVVRYLQG
jgi:tetratricopeptide (TPR) repeat protein